MSPNSNHCNMETITPSSRLHIDRPLYDQQKLNQLVNYDNSEKKTFKNVRFKCQPKKAIKKAIPVLSWIPQYQWKNDFFGDLIAGFTIAVMHIPQGMAYGLLGNVPPVVGLYMAFFPTLVYFFFGTSRHVSMGTFAVVCLMTGKSVSLYSKPEHNTLLSANGTEEISAAALENDFTPIEVATAVTFMTGIFMIIMYIFRLGILTSLLSETLVNGFTFGASIHVVTSQIKDLFGFKTIKRNGLFKIIYAYVDIINNISSINYVATIISVISITILIFNNEVIKKWVSKKTSFPVPIELLAVVIGTVTSRCLQLSEVYNITTVGEIQTGIPPATLPRMELLSIVAVDSISITLVSYSISLSMGLIFAQKCGYEVDANQELLAQGVGNIVGSFFSCLPFSASLSRSVIQQNVGGKTQVASVVSCGLILVVLLWIGPFFESLPRCVLASVIVVALKGLLWQAGDIVKFWKLSKIDATIWIVTVLSSIFLDIDYGLLVGVLISLTTLILRALLPYTCILGSVPNTDIYLDTELYKGIIELPGIKIFHYCGGLNFALKSHFRNEVYKLVQINPENELVKRRKSIKKEAKTENKNGSVSHLIKEIDVIDLNWPTIQPKIDIKFIIMDFSALNYTDPSGVKAIRNLVENYKKIDITIYISGCSGAIYEMIKKCYKCEGIENDLYFFPTIHDAVSNAECIINKTYLKYETIHL